jgi:uncharacterized protein
VSRISAHAALDVEFLASLEDFDPALWNDLAGDDYPFMRHEFLWGLEKTGCTSASNGWQPCHAVIRRGATVAAIMPMYLKDHSYGEYVFDWAWADAWQRSGLAYYPKLVTAIPFTPATGPRLGATESLDQATAYNVLLQGIKTLASKRQISSWHLLFPEEIVATNLANQGIHRRTATQFHWFNEGFADFDDFLATFNSRKRKTLKRERKRVAEQGLVLRTLQGAEITALQWQQFYHFYQLTYARRSGHRGYLNQAFFSEVAASLGDRVVMVLAYLKNVPVAGALYFRSRETLYGRYWGAVEEFDCLHFETCYYQGIEYCITNGLKKFDPGAQGEHKIQRGFKPIKTFSNHWIANPQLSAAVAEFTAREEVHTNEYIADAYGLLPFKDLP